MWHVSLNGISEQVCKSIDTQIASMPDGADKTGLCLAARHIKALVMMNPSREIEVAAYGEGKFNHEDDQISGQVTVSVWGKSRLLAHTKRGRRAGKQ